MRSFSDAPARRRASAMYSRSTGGVVLLLQGARDEVLHGDEQCANGQEEAELVPDGQRAERSLLWRGWRCGEGAFDVG